MQTKQPKKESQSKTIKNTNLIQYVVYVAFFITTVVNTTAFNAKAEEILWLKEAASWWNILAGAVTSSVAFSSGSTIKQERRGLGDLVKDNEQEQFTEAVDQAHRVASFTKEEFERLESIKPYITGAVDVGVALTRVSQSVQSVIDLPVLRDPK